MNTSKEIQIPESLEEQESLHCAQWETWQQCKIALSAPGAQKTPESATVQKMQLAVDTLDKVEGVLYKELVIDELPKKEGESPRLEKDVTYRTRLQNGQRMQLLVFDKTFTFDMTLKADVAVLTINSECGIPRTLELKPGRKIRIGRNQAATLGRGGIHISDESRKAVSSMHLEVSFSPSGNILLKDLSKNGTFMPDLT